MKFMLLMLSVILISCGQDSTIATRTEYVPVAAPTPVVLPGEEVAVYYVDIMCTSIVQVNGMPTIIAGGVQCPLRLPYNSEVKTTELTVQNFVVLGNTVISRNCDDTNVFADDELIRVKDGCGGTFRVFYTIE
jgi:hypothetical protein